MTKSLRFASQLTRISARVRIRGLRTFFDDTRASEPGVRPSWIFDERQDAKTPERRNAKTELQSRIFKKRGCIFLASPLLTSIGSALDEF